MSETTDRLDFVEARCDDLTNRVELLEIIAKKTGPAEPEGERSRKVTQINMGGKKFICVTAEEESIFAQNNPGVEVETYHIELPEHVIQGYLDDPENMKQFTRKEKVNA